MSVRYLPGPNPAYVGASVVVISTPDRLAAISALAGTEVDALSLVDTLAGGDLSAMPDFVAVMIHPAGLRVIARGAFEVAVGTWTCSGADVMTWAEQVLATWSGEEVVISGAPGAGSTWLPLNGGVVLAGPLVWTPVAAATSGPMDRATQFSISPLEPSSDHATSAAAAPTEPVSNVPDLPAGPVIEPDFHPEPKLPVASNAADAVGIGAPKPEPQVAAQAEAAAAHLPVADAGLEPEPGLPAIADPTDTDGAAVGVGVSDPEPEPQVAAQAKAAAAPHVPVADAGPEPAPVPEPTSDADADADATRMESDDAYDAMFGRTVHGRRPEDAAVREPVDVPVVTPPPVAERLDPASRDAAAGQPAAVSTGESGPPTLVGPPPTPAGTQAAGKGDHDGRTITAAQMRAQRAQHVPAVETQVTASLTFSTGRVVTVDRPVLVGRAPRTTQASSADLPTLVVIDDPYISSTHLEVARRGPVLVATDRSTNGTVLSRPGRPPQQLVRDEPTELSDGCALALSDAVSVTVAMGGS